MICPGKRLANEAAEGSVTGAVNEEAREVIFDLSHSLEERPPSVLHLLEQPPLSAFCAEKSNKKLILKKVSAPHSVVASLQPITYCVCSFKKAAERYIQANNAKNLWLWLDSCYTSLPG